MKQIKTQTYPAYGGAHHNPYGGAARQGKSYYPGTGGQSYQGNGRAGTWEHPQNQNPKAAGSEGSNKSPFPVSTPSRISGERLGPTMQPGNYQRNLSLVEAGGNLGKADADEKEDDRRLRQQLAEGPSHFKEEFRGSAFGFNIHDFYSGLYDDSPNPEEVILQADREDYDKAFGKDEINEINVSFEDEAVLLLDEVMRTAIPFQDDARYNELAVEMGKYRASCFLFVEMASSLFHEEDRHLNNIIFEYYQMLSEEGKGKLFRGLVEILPEAERRKVEAYGL